MYLNEKERIPIFHSLSRIFFFSRQNIDITRASLHRRFCLNPFFTSRGALITINAPDIRPQKSGFFKICLTLLIRPCQNQIIDLNAQSRAKVGFVGWVLLTMSAKKVQKDPGPTNVIMIILIEIMEKYTSSDKEFGINFARGKNVY